MRNKLYLALVFGSLMIFLGSSVCAAPVTIGVNCTMEQGGAEEAGILKFKELIEAKSEGRMEVKMLMGGLLGSEKEVLELLKNGSTEMAVTGGLFRSMYAKEFDPISIPFYLKSWECVQAYMDGPLGAKIKELAIQHGGIIDFGVQKRAPRQMTSNRKIVEPADIEGLKMRLPSIPLWVDVWKELGAVSIVIPAPEIYDAMKSNAVEAHENTLVSPYSRKLYEVQKYIIVTNHVFFPWHWVASKTWYDRLDPKDRELIQACVNEARAYGTKIEDEKDEFYATELKKMGMEFITPNMEAIRKKAMPAIQRAVRELSPEVAVEVENVCK